MALKLQVIICSTRPGRIGPSIANWFYNFANENSAFDCELVDLADFDLPVYDEPKHPRMQQYENEATQAWSNTVARADAYIFVLPEYNFFPPPSFVNAIDYLFNEWNYKPCSFVSYGGVSGGLRAVQVAKQLVTTVKMMPIPESVTVQMPWLLLNDEKEFTAEEPHLNSAAVMLEELNKWAGALQPLRD